MEWLRWYHGTVNDPKWRTIARRAGVRVADVVAVWATLLEDASQSDGRGTLDGWCAEDVASALDLETEQVEAIYDAMQGKVRDGDALTGWEKRQPKREDNSTDRVRAHRERKRQEAGNQADVTQRNAGETQRNAPEEIRGEERTTTETVAKATGGGAPIEQAPNTDPAPAPPALPQSTQTPGAAPLDPDAVARAALSFRFPDLEDPPPAPPPPPERPDTESEWAESRGRIAGAIREHAWLHRAAPQVGGRSRKWGMNNELSIARELLRQYSPDELIGGMEHWRRVHSTPEGQQWTLAACYAEGQRWRMELAVDAWRNAEIDAINLAEYMERRHAS